MESNYDYLKSLLKKLGEPIMPNWRVQQFSERKAEAMCMPYVNARDVMDRLDDCCIYGWQRDHFTINSDVYCKIGINMPDGTIHWRSDAGKEANTEAEKSKSSDSFKRAAVNWKIGRFLYDTDIIRLPTNRALVKGDRDRPYITDSVGNRVWDLNKHISKGVKNGSIKIESLSDLMERVEDGRSGKETETPPRPQPKKPQPPKEEPKTSAIQPNQTFYDSKSLAKTPTKGEIDKRKSAALVELNKIGEAKVIGHLVKTKRIDNKDVKLAIWINKEDTPLAVIEEIYKELKK